MRNLIFSYPIKSYSSSSSSSSSSSLSSPSSPSKRFSNSVKYHPVVLEKSTYSPFASLFPIPPASHLNPSATLRLPTSTSSSSTSFAPSTSAPPFLFRLEIESLHISRGQFVAIVGPPGSGKSTLLNLLLRLYEPVEGIILFDGKDSRNINPECLRSHIG